MKKAKRKKKKPASPKVKMQFSKKVCIAGIVLVAISWFGNFLLLYMGREGMSDVTMTMITVFGGFATGGYFTLSGVRDISVNKLKQTHVECGVDKDDAH